MMPVISFDTDKVVVNNNQIQKLILGDEDAFKKIYDQYAQKVYRLAFHYLKGKDWSEEIVQETFIKLWLNRESLDTEGDIWSYLSLISKRLSLNLIREISRSTSLTDKLISNIEEVYNATEENIYANDLEQITEKLINKLPRQQQLIYKLSRVDGLSHKEIADQLSISPNTVKNHMVQALKTIKANLNFSYLISIIIVLFVRFLF
ncbi:RNA polymerase sigma factor [Mucilaginibacter sp. X5P1]|uniref:RNA polymerase sigma factor n=1 Tax=Mucilaginibacter sp. X5P1 TaxID=2723088 RepID=UPI00160C492B|nr:RNA polymerase sigma-70 factor [Mucilaginibacter sp. X5P1]MBB6138101.1 RNA polymerase sigma-70 factor (ECF subfamily) [Mucilaginibacter sp. X5P1]